MFKTYTNTWLLKLKSKTKDIFPPQGTKASKKKQSPPGF